MARKNRLLISKQNSYSGSILLHLQLQLWNIDLPVYKIKTAAFPRLANWFQVAIANSQSHCQRAGLRAMWWFSCEEVDGILATPGPQAHPFCSGVSRGYMFFQKKRRYIEVIEVLYPKKSDRESLGLLLIAVFFLCLWCWLKIQVPWAVDPTYNHRRQPLTWGSPTAFSTFLVSEAAGRVSPLCNLRDVGKGEEVMWFKVKLVEWKYYGNLKQQCKWWETDRHARTDRMAIENLVENDNHGNCHWHHGSSEKLWQSWNH